jgi:uncharacterized protein YgiM (DUF1202 family)
MRYPTNYVAISKDYKKGSHYGIDLGWSTKNGGKNQPIYATDDGKVIYHQTQTSGGKVIHIKHDNGYVTEYAHLDTWVVKKGDKVKMGQKIGTMGKSGNASGEHLHLGVYKGSKINYNKPSGWVDPKKYLYTTQDQKVGATTAKKYDIKEFPIKKVIAQPTLNVRKKPQLLSKKVDSLPYKEEVEVVKTSGSWSKISYNEDKWVSSKYLK